MFQSITSVYEDGDGNFFLLDINACKVYKFSPEGKLLLTFGDRRKGPSYFEYPHAALYVADHGKIVVKVKGA